MTNGLVLDILIICLLAASTGYCITLNRRLKLLRQGQEEFSQLIGRFDDATQRTETNIDRLRNVSSEIDESLGERISTARGLRDELQFLIERAAPAHDRTLTRAASRPEPPAAPFTMSPQDGVSESLVESDLLDALREARKG